MQRHEPTRDGSVHRPTAAEIREELGRILASPLFEQAGRSSEFLSFVVEESLAGRADRIKGYTLGIEVFDRPEDFDAQSDPLVRVEAGRLRRRIMEYYQADGSDNPVRIELPSVGYAPLFSYSPTKAELEKAERTRLWQWGAGVLAVGLAVAAIGIFTNSLDNGVPNVEEDRFETSSPRVNVMPLAALSGDRDIGFFARALTEEILLALVEFDVVASSSELGGLPESTDAIDLARDANADYVLTGSIRPQGNTVRVTIRVMEQVSGRQVWTTSFDNRSSATGGAPSESAIAREIAMIVSSPFGPLIDNEVRRYADEPIESISEYACLLRFFGYIRSLDREDYDDARNCLERFTADNSENAEAWAALATIYLHHHQYGYGTFPEGVDPLERATEAARRALDIDGNDRLGTTAMSSVRIARGDASGFEQSVDRVLAMDPVHPAMLIATGFQLTIQGDWQRGIPMLDEAIPVTAVVPGWVYTAYAFRYLLTGEYEQALEWAHRADIPGWFVDPLTTAAAAALSGRDDIAQREAESLLSLFPNFAERGRVQLQNWRIDPELIEILLAGIEQAGIEVR